MEWNDKYGTGVTAVDAQHKELFHMLSTLQSSIKRGEGQKEFVSTIKALVEYTKYHFEDEERLMKSTGYPQYEDHRLIHCNLIEEVKKILLRLKEGQDVNAKELMWFLHDWVSKHILDEDLKIGEYIQCRKRKSAAAVPLLGDVGAEITAKLKTLADLYEQKLIDDSDYIREKGAMFDRSLQAEIIDEPDGVVHALDLVAETVKDELIDGDDKGRIEAALLAKCDLQYLVFKVPELKGRLAFVKRLFDDGLINGALNEKLKGGILEDI